MDIVKFAETYCLVKQLDGSFKPIQLRDWQKHWLKNSTLLFKGERQCGITTLLVIKVAHFLIFSKRERRPKLILFKSHNYKSNLDFIKKVKSIIEFYIWYNTPNWELSRFNQIFNHPDKPKINFKKNQSEIIELSNDNTIKTLQSESISEIINKTYEYEVFGLILDNSNYIKNKHELIENFKKITQSNLVVDVWTAEYSHCINQYQPPVVPVGLLPKKHFEAITKLNRVNNIKEAIQRYIEVEKEIPKEWIEEYNELIKK